MNSNEINSIGYEIQAKYTSGLVSFRLLKELDLLRLKPHIMIQTKTMAQQCADRVFISKKDIIILPPVDYGSPKAWHGRPTFLPPV